MFSHAGIKPIMSTTKKGNQRFPQTAQIRSEKNAVKEVNPAYRYREIAHTCVAEEYHYLDDVVDIQISVTAMQMFQYTFLG